VNALAKAHVSRAKALLSSAPDEEFSAKAKAMVAEWGAEEPSVESVAATLSHIKRHQLGRKTAIHLLTSILLALQEQGH